MSAPRALAQPSCIAVFDLDGTLTWHDTLLPYLAGYTARHPAHCLRLWRILPALVAFAWNRDRGILKSRLIRTVMGGDSRQQIDAWSDTFVSSLTAHRAFRPAGLTRLTAHRTAGDHLVLLSASPDLYVPRIGRLLGFERALCTELEWRTIDGVERLDGALHTPNRRGAEKVECLAWLRSRYPGLPVVAYGNSSSDLPHLTQADRPLLVNGNGRARRRAVALGIAVEDWR